MEKSTSRNKSVRIVVPWTTGLHSLPDAGGILDQPHRTMIFFGQFIAGDREAANKRLKSSS